MKQCCFASPSGLQRTKDGTLILKERINVILIQCAVRHYSETVPEAGCRHKTSSARLKSFVMSPGPEIRVTALFRGCGDFFLLLWKMDLGANLHLM